ncbi:PucR family transcriptional regulator [Halalkalibacter oceani]|uniref:PucR family transcriptional regulator n=1 Tax=Halalkalibacter oceani TaxID=1653776 RepID=UPI0033955BB9
MIEKVKRQFAGAIFPGSYQPDAEGVLWFEGEDEKPLGFVKAKLTENEQMLLSLLLEAYRPLPLPKSLSEKQWADWLFHQGKPPTQPESVQLIHFLLEKQIEDVAAFQQIWESEFDLSMTFLWISPTRGVIVTDARQQDYESPDYLSFCEALSTDFYVDVTLLIGASQPRSLAKSQFQWESACFDRFVAPKKRKRVYYEYELIPYFWLQSLSAQERSQFISRIFDKELLADQELLKSLRFYFESNLNISAAAKALHMHRNSLQYRIDKWMERTSFDIRQFPQAVVVYVALLLLEEGVYPK